MIQKLTQQLHDGCIVYTTVMFQTEVHVYICVILVKDQTPFVRVLHEKEENV